MRNRFKAYGIIAVALAWLAGCAEEPPAPPDIQRSVTIMTFNVENLFDNIDDAGKDDATFLALADKQSAAHKSACAGIPVDRWRDQCLYWDWNDAIIEEKLRVVAETILQVDDGRGPDILALQEIENLAILERLRAEHLGAAGYLPAILIEGQDNRGIDVAFLSRLDLAEPPVLHGIDFSAEFAERVGDTRGILQAMFVLPDGQLLTGFSVHFPAPFHPTGMRIEAYERLNELRAGVPADRAAFAAGDFNTTASEAAEMRMLERLVRPHWQVAHELGCESCPGTQYYARDDSWSFLDMILWSSAASRGAQATWTLRGDSVRIANEHPQQRRDDGTPRRFEIADGGGVSDHWPLVVTVEIK